MKISIPLIVLLSLVLAACGTQPSLPTPTAVTELPNPTTLSYEQYDPAVIGIVLEPGQSRSIQTTDGRYFAADNICCQTPEQLAARLSPFPSKTCLKVRASNTGHLDFQRKNHELPLVDAFLNKKVEIQIDLTSIKTVIDNLNTIQHFTFPLPHVIMST